MVLHTRSKILDVTLRALLWSVLFRMRILSVILLFLVIQTLPPATFAKLLEPAAHQTAVTREIVEKLSQDHYRKLAIDDALSGELLDQYLTTLDGGKSYFLRADIDEFNQWRTTLDDAVKAGDVTPAYRIFNRFVERIQHRLQANVDLLESGYEFDFDRIEYLDMDVDNRAWPAAIADADELWRKRIKDSLLRLMIADKEPAAARELLIKRYRNQINQIEQQDNEDVFQAFVNALTGLYDPHTNYLSPRTLENFNISMSLSLEGIGAVLQSEDEYTKIVRVIPGGPADRQGKLAAEDKIVAVGEGNDGVMVDVVGWRLDEVVELIRGPKDSFVRLQIIPAKAEAQEKPVVLTIQRDKVKLEEQSAKSRILQIPQGERTLKIGVIEIPAFYLDFEAYRKRDPNFKSTTRDVQKLLEDLRAEAVDGIVLDLRNNGGGSLFEATSLTDLFIDPGPVVQIRHANQRISRDNRSRFQAYYKGPLVVLMNRLSASASEIFAGAIQDYNRGLIVGSQSFGKGTVQVMVPLGEGQLKLTESKFYRISGESTQHRGVLPDISFPSFYEDSEVGESSQEHALPWDKIHRVSHRTYRDIDPILEELRALHDSRVKLDPDWVHMLDEISILKSRNKIKKVPLNLSERRALNERQEQEMLDIENKRRRAKNLTPFATVKEWREELEKEDEEKKAQNKSNLEQTEPDPLLKESGQILIDYMTLTVRSTPRLVAQ